MSTVGITQMRRELSMLINRVAFGRERIILQSRGRPKAALVSIEDLKRLQEMDGEAGRVPMAAQDEATLMARRQRAIAAAGRFRSGLGDLSARHDKYLAEIEP